MQTVFPNIKGWRNFEVECMIESDVELRKTWACETLQSCSLQSPVHVHAYILWWEEAQWEWGSQTLGPPIYIYIYIYI